MSQRWLRIRHWITRYHNKYDRNNTARIAGCRCGWQR